MWQLRWGSFGPSPREWPLVSIHMPTFFANDYPRLMRMGGEGRGGEGESRKLDGKLRNREVYSASFRLSTWRRRNPTSTSRTTSRSIKLKTSLLHRKPMGFCDGPGEIRATVSFSC